jgi:lysophospholipase L1-like esterase
VRLLLAAAAVYLVFLHPVIVVTLWNADQAYRDNLRKIDASMAQVYEFSIDSRTRHIANGYYKTIDRLMRASPVVLLGDSITEGMPVTPGIGRSLNVGLAGLTARELPVTLSRYPSLDRAAAIVMTIGINDLCLERAAEAELPGRIDRLAAALPRGVPLVWGAILPLDPVAARQHCSAPNEAIGRTNGLIAKACAAMPGCTYVDAYAAMADPQGNLIPRYHVGDGIHLSKEGYAAWLKVLGAGLAKTGRKGG